MGRFETPCQVFGLFLGAALVSVAVIFVLRIEAINRYGSGMERSNGVETRSRLEVIPEALPLIRESSGETSEKSKSE